MKVRRTFDPNINTKKKKRENVAFVGHFAGKLGAGQFPFSSTGRDKCNTTLTQSIATFPNLHRKGHNLKQFLFKCHDQFCMDLHSSRVKKAESKPAKLTRDPLAKAESAVFP